MYFIMFPMYLYFWPMYLKLLSRFGKLPSRQLNSIVRSKERTFMFSRHIYKEKQFEQCQKWREIVKVLSFERTIEIRSLEWFSQQSSLYLSGSARAWHGVVWMVWWEISTAVVIKSNTKYGFNPIKQNKVIVPKTRPL